MEMPTHPAAYSITPEFRLLIELELAAVLRGTNFRSSRRSCEFLRFVVESALDGRVDLLKERSLGVAVFRRDAAYDTSSDAAVRVRATNVRRRLASHYWSSLPREGWRIDLPVGSYIPRFSHV